MADLNGMAAALFNGKSGVRRPFVVGKCPNCNEDIAGVALYSLPTDAPTSAVPPKTASVSTTLAGILVHHECAS